MPYDAACQAHWRRWFRIAVPAKLTGGGSLVLSCLMMVPAKLIAAGGLGYVAT